MDKSKAWASPFIRVVKVTVKAGLSQLHHAPEVELLNGRSDVARIWVWGAPEAGQRKT